ncbi:MAG: UbiD family decarboxylase [Gammaproteobacteria bacterium]|nr:UbiD family decarboxylase [Gammaproteobacteria bacterium]MCP4088252.1 UbiD family decarboxylase [Gammaproteobacteria bacterium]MCP4276437.1 UbiD family decarboxylase [Gammaproteobacteria bacterium]MCP4831084.1 UbiD family decarboxylase [Gammaproteobacteria bacterium]MCP4929352.1 UbiD family decarboxylase [Gammaproteobacteria bacterium]
MSDPKQPENKSQLDRRMFLAAGTGIAALTAGCSSLANQNKTPAPGIVASGDVPTAPFDSIRDYMAAMEAHGLLMRFPEIDQDKYEATGLFFKATDLFGMYGTPAMIFERIKINGQWVQGPVMVNTQGHWNADSIAFGLKPEPREHYKNYRAVKTKMKKMLATNNGRYPEIPPNEVTRDTAPCKEVTLEGDDIDLTKFAFLQTNPADDGRYINTASIFTSDPEMGGNYGTYRCALRGPRHLGFNPEPNQTGNKMMMAAKERGEKSAKIALVLGQDPIVWMISGSRIAPRFGPKPKPVDELAIAGGLRGKAMDVVRCDTNDMLVPAHCEMVIEGEVPLDDASMEPEGPFGEMFGYLGPRKKSNFVINVTRVTHRTKPWLMNAFTGMQRGMLTAPMDALYEVFLKKLVPGIVEYQTPQYCMGVVFMSIDKTKPGEGLKSGRTIAKSNPIAKVVVVVDKDINILNPIEMLMTIGSRWQPYPATLIIEEAFGLMTDPSQVENRKTSKIVIDATMQWPEEGGQEEFPLRNRTLLEQGEPDIWEIVDSKFGETLRNWKEV